MSLVSSTFECTLITVHVYRYRLRAVHYKGLHAHILTQRACCLVWTGDQGECTWNLHPTFFIQRLHFTFRTHSDYVFSADYKSTCMCYFAHRASQDSGAHSGVHFKVRRAAGVPCLRPWRVLLDLSVTVTGPLQLRRMPPAPCLRRCRACCRPCWTPG